MRAQTSTVYKTALGGVLIKEVEEMMLSRIRNSKL
jgi:hypothetical protein